MKFAKKVSSSLLLSRLLQEGECMLNITEDKAELAHFKDQWMTPQQMIKVCQLVNEIWSLLADLVLRPEASYAVRRWRRYRRR